LDASFGISRLVKQNGFLGLPVHQTSVCYILFGDYVKNKVYSSKVTSLQDFRGRIEENSATIIEHMSERTLIAAIPSYKQLMSK
jgi:hypothetical protein